MVFNDEKNLDSSQRSCIFGISTGDVALNLSDDWREVSWEALALNGVNAVIATPLNSDALRNSSPYKQELP